MNPAEVWSAERGRQFRRHPEEVRGYIRYEVTRENIQNTLSDYLSLPRRIIDIGAGEGRDAEWFAALAAGHEVSLVEPDIEAFTVAMRNQQNVKNMSRCDTDGALRRFGEGAFELLVSHGVLQYIDNPRAELKKIARLLEPEGYMSMLIAGKFGKLRRYSNDQTKLKRLLLDGQFTNNLGVRATSYLPQEVESMFSSAGLEIVDWFGTRIVTDDDRRNVSEVPALELNRLLALEIKLSRDPGRRAEGQMLHYIARKIT